MPGLSNQVQDVWAATSRFQILGIDDSQEPEGMKIARDGEEIGFIGNSEDKLRGWGWLKTTKDLELRNYKEFFRRRGFRAIIIRAGEFFRVMETLPEGEVKIRFHISKINSPDHAPHLIVNFNNDPILSQDLLEPGDFEITKEVHIGGCALEFQHVAPEGENPSNSENYFLIDSLRIETQNDIILLFTPKSETGEPPAGNFQATYYTLHPDSNAELEVPRRDARSLYLFKSDYPLKDLGIEKNPHQIKKKVPLGEDTFNALYAPTDSRFMFEVWIPKNCYLEFACGFLEESYAASHGEVHFKIEIETKGKEKSVLFSEKLTPSRRKDYSSHRIELLPYADHKVKIFFSTEDVPTDNKKGNHSSLWINPILYRRSAETTPKIILVSLDTLRADHLGCYGYALDTSPSMDMLALDGVFFKNTYSTTSWTLPSHISLFTSLNTPRHGVVNMLHRLDDSIPTLADILRNHSYYCAAFTGGGYIRRTYGFAKGFDSFHQIMQGNRQHVRIDEAESLNKKTEAWLDHNYDKKFFLFLHTYQPHIPYENKSEAGQMFLNENSQRQKVKAKDIFKGRGKYRAPLSEEQRNNIIALYDGEIRYTDEYLIKPLVAKLKALGIYNQTLLIVTSDHGEEFYDHQNWLHGSTLYNELIKIPLIVKFPDSRFQGTSVENIARITDIMPTILEEANVDPSLFDLDGVSLLPLIKGEEQAERIFYADLIFRRVKDIAPQMFATNKNGLKYIQSQKIKSYFTKRMAVDLEGKKIEIYDLSKDPGEKKNLADRDDYKSLCLELMAHLARYYQSHSGRQAESIKMDPELRETLKALGYIR